MYGTFPPRGRASLSQKGRGHVFIVIAIFACISAAVSFSCRMQTTDDNNAARMALVDKINETPNVLWQAGINPRFVGNPIGAAKALCGVRVSGTLPRARQLPSIVGSIDDKLNDTSLPDEFDSATTWTECADIINKIHDQSNCGCCWAMAAAAAASDRMCISTQGKAKVSLSAQEVCFCGRVGNGCDGGDTSSAWGFIKEGVVTGGLFNGTGYCSDYSLPPCHHHGPVRNDPYPLENSPECPVIMESPKCPTECGATAQPPHSIFKADKYAFSGPIHWYVGVKAISQAIMQHGPVVVSVMIHEDFENYVSGIYHFVAGESLGVHAVRLVGWGMEDGVSYWKAANSWNPYWGEQGFFRIRRGVNEGTLEEQAVANGPDSHWFRLQT